MSLIPSESLNFPDSFRANVGWRLADEDELESGSSKQQVPSSAWPQSSPPDPHSEQGTTGTADPEAMTTAGDSGQSDAQLELLPSINPNSDSLESASGTAEMTALLKHFLTAGTQTPSVQPGESMPAADPVLELHPGSAIAADQAANGRHDSIAKEVAAPNEEPLSEAGPPPNRSEMTTEPAPGLVGAAATVPGSASDLTELKPAEPEQPTPARAPEHISAEASTPVTGSIAVESSAQAQHVLELIAAAVQRGALVGQNVPAAEAPVVLPATPLFEEKVNAGPDPNLAPAPAINPLVTPAFGAAAPVTPPAEVKGHAKIRITPRKIKPRPVAPAAPPPDAVTEDLPAHLTDFGDAEITAKAAVEKPAAIPEPDVAFVPEPVSTRPTREDLIGRRTAAARHQFAQTDLLLFTARARRNRWIGFGLSELAVLTALVLLGRFGFTHRFPDPTIKLLVFILIFVAAAVAVALPIAFFRNSPERWGRDQAR
ncbi:MAG: hypothetical protein ACJ8M1_04910 [Chthoniobacterales bacterium]